MNLKNDLKQSSASSTKNLRQVFDSVSRRSQNCSTQILFPQAANAMYRALLAVFPHQPNSPIELDQLISNIPAANFNYKGMFSAEDLQGHIFFTDVD